MRDGLDLFSSLKLDSDDENVSPSIRAALFSGLVHGSYLAVKEFKAPQKIKHYGLNLEFNYSDGVKIHDENHPDNNMYFLFSKNIQGFFITDKNTSYEDMKKIFNSFFKRFGAMMNGERMIYTPGIESVTFNSVEEIEGLNKTDAMTIALNAVSKHVDSFNEFSDILNEKEQVRPKTSISEYKTLFNGLREITVNIPALFA